MDDELVAVADEERADPATTRNQSAETTWSEKPNGLVACSAAASNRIESPASASLSPPVVTTIGSTSDSGWRGPARALEP